MKTLALTVAAALLAVGLQAQRSKADSLAFTRARYIHDSYLKPGTFYKGDSPYHKGLAEKPAAMFSVILQRMVRTVSFEEETLYGYAWTIDRRNDTCRLICNSIYTPAANSNERAEKLKQTRIAIDTALYRSVAELFSVAMRKMEERPTSGSEMWIMDGIMYYFAATDPQGNVTVGTASSPGKGSPLFRLADIAREIYTLAAGGKAPCQTELMERIGILIEDMKNVYVSNLCTIEIPA